MLGAALTSKSLRSELEPCDFSDPDIQEAVREMKRVDGNESPCPTELTKVPHLMKSMGIEVGNRPASQALLETVKIDSRKRRLKAIASSIQISNLSNDAMIDDYLKKIAEV